MRKPDRTEFPAVTALLLSSDLRLLVCHGLTCLAVAGGRLLYPGDAQVEPLEASRIRVLLLIGHPRCCLDRRRGRACYCLPLSEGLEKTSPSRRW